ncbi:MBL fold metallo-hydrolase [Rhodococcus sp. USK10]|uniref:MBL fold metallo-hydrolase n=1 Tax=Rhodococcus sp. USK10 TaxID=2789739 RepID=UPI001C5D2B01|nr:MBL fold metallo-hydrolase [Rhodococcus sp. USK10]QYB07357.1 MBL fold metallo-hydrolase [Rhodococcus sp. USK10]
MDYARGRGFYRRDRESRTGGKVIYLDDHSRRILSIPLVIFVLRSGDRAVVVDTGGPADEAQIRRMIPFGYAVKEADSMENALTRLGVRADDVDLVINTHLH